MNKCLPIPDGNNSKSKQGDHPSPSGETVHVGATYEDMGEGLPAGAGLIQEQLPPQTLTLAHKRWSHRSRCTTFRYVNRSESLFPAVQLV